MTNDLVTIQCPSCEKTFPILLEQDQVFCSFCGTRVNNRDVKEVAVFEYWHQSFIKNTDPKARMQSIEGLDQFEDKAKYRDVLKDLLAKRYRVISKSGDVADHFVELVSSLVFCSTTSSVNSAPKRGLKLVKQFIKKYNLEPFVIGDELSVEILKNELFNVFYLYAYLCRSDKVYNSLILGMGRVKDEKTYDKMNTEFTNIKNRVLIPNQGLLFFDLLLETSQLAFEEYWNEYPVVTE